MKNKGFALTMTVMWSVVMVYAMHSRVGIAMGLCIGMAFGLFDTGETEPGREARPEEDGPDGNDGKL